MKLVKEKKKSEFNQRFSIVERIGEGGTSIIYKAKDTLLHRNVAIKKLKPELQNNFYYREMIKKEAENYSLFEHPNILPLYDQLKTSEGPLLVIRKCKNSFSNIISDNSVKSTTKLLILKQIATAIDFLREKGFVHRDIKPGNIMLDDKYHAYLIDLGTIFEFRSSIEEEHIIGTPEYMSPEVLEGKNSFVFNDNSLGLKYSDTFSFGVMLYKTLCKQHPFEKNTNPKYNNSTWEHCSGIRVLRGEKPTPCTQWDLTIPRIVNETINTMLSRDPEKRPPSLTNSMDLIIKAYEGKHIYDSKVFISYSQNDESLASSVANHLSKEGFQVWRDNLLEFGSTWDDQIEEKLMGSDALLVIVSENSNKSTEVKNEWKYCLEYRPNLPIIPIVIDTSRLPYRLAALQRINASSNLSNESLKDIVTALEGSIIVATDEANLQSSVDSEKLNLNTPTRFLIRPQLSESTLTPLYGPSKAPGILNAPTRLLKPPMDITIFTSHEKI